jgi:hypothetical protein
MQYRIAPKPAVVLLACMLSGCAATATPAQQALESRRVFNTTLETIHTLHEAGTVSSQQERDLLPVIQAASAALDQMDADALNGNAAGFDVAVAALNAALSQMNVTITQAKQPATKQSARPTTAPSTRPVPTTGA